MPTGMLTFLPPLGATTTVRSLTSVELVDPSYARASLAPIVTSESLIPASEISGATPSSCTINTNKFILPPGAPAPSFPGTTPIIEFPFSGPCAFKSANPALLLCASHPAFPAPGSPVRGKGGGRRWRGWGGGG